MYLPKSPSLLLSTLSIILTHLLHPSGAKSENTVGDPYIICPNAWVPDHAHGLPRGYDTADYFNPMQLCSALNGNHRNVGCACSTDNAHSFYCYERVADRRLYDARIRPSQQPFPDFCAASCMCSDITSAREARLGTARAGRTNQSAGAAAGVGQAGYFDPNYHITSTGQSAGSRSSSSRGGSQGYDPISGWEAKGAEASAAPTAVTVSHEQCGGNCTSQAECATGGGCMCSTRSEQYQPGSGTVAFVAACIMSMSGGGGKREVGGGAPCPCNSTYVSQACCGAADGVVWEEGRFKLGELVDS